MAGRSTAEQRCTRAAERGLSILRPWGDSSPYDVALVYPEDASTEKACRENGHPRPSILRVQIKSTECRHSAGAYKCHIDSNGVPYRPGLLDFIAAYVIPEADDPRSRGI